MNTQKLIDLLEERGFTVGLAEGGTELTMACPLCFDESKRLYLSTEHGSWICFRCRDKGHLRSFLMEVCEMSFTEATTTERSLLTGKRVRPALITPRPAPASSVKLPQGFTPLTTRASGGTVAVRYLKERGVTLGQAEDLGMGYCMVGPYGCRVIIPVYTQGELRTFVARTWVEGESKKVLMPPGSQAERALFGYDNLLRACPSIAGISPRTFIITEGVFDVLRLRDLGYYYTVATLGAHITPLQQTLVKKEVVKRLSPSSVVLLRDGDDAGREAAIKEGRQLVYDMIPVSIAHLPEGTDPGSATPEEIRTALINAKPVEKDYGIESQMEVHNERHD